ncbi:hypothetical protein C8J57DRAFT_1223052 [Mycena rebaudengoi]|nr:hypothetical protein C8J57DRAFT_1223052 [Mycena rebaudengoi]
MYLTLTAGLKVTTPALFRLVLANQTASFAAKSTLSSPFLHSSLWTGSRPGYASDPQFISSATFSASLMMNNGDRHSDEFRLGLQNNMIYDVVAADTGPGTTTVNTHTMNVTCGTPSSGITSSLFTNPRNGVLYWGLASFDAISETAPNVLHITNYFDLDSSTIEVYGSFNVSDTSGKGATEVLLDPPMNPLLSAGPEINSFVDHSIGELNITAISKFNVSSLSYIRCSLAIINSSSLLDTSSRKLLRPDAPRKMTSSWPTFDNENPRFTGHTESLAFPKNLQEVRTFFGLQAFKLQAFRSDDLSRNLSNSSFCTKPEVHLEPASNEVWDYETPCTYLTQSDRALMDKVSIHPPARDYECNVNVMLHDFENALEDYAAAFYWSYTDSNAVAYLRNSPTSHKIEVTGSKLVSQLQLNTLPFSGEAHMFPSGGSYSSPASALFALHIRGSVVKYHLPSWPILTDDNFRQPLILRREYLTAEKA